MLTLHAVNCRTQVKHRNGKGEDGLEDSDADEEEDVVEDAVVDKGGMPLNIHSSSSSSSPNKGTTLNCRHSNSSGKGR
jgi:hypothetical protein